MPCNAAENRPAAGQIVGGAHVQQVGPALEVRQVEHHRSRQGHGRRVIHVHQHPPFFRRAHRPTQPSLSPRTGTLDHFHGQRLRQRNRRHATSRLCDERALAQFHCLETRMVHVRNKRDGRNPRHSPLHAHHNVAVLVNLR